MKKLVIIPCYNEQETIMNVIESVKKEKIDFIVVNDGSTDQSKEILKKNKIPFLNLYNNLGIGGAMQTGYRYAYKNGYDIAIQVDGDGQHNAKYIKKLVEPIEKGEANIVIGSRFVGKKQGFRSSPMRRIGIGILSFLIYIISKKRIKDTTSGFRAVDRAVIEKWAKHYPHEYPEPVTNLSMLKSGRKVIEVPVRMNPRMQGYSSIRKWKAIYYMINVMIFFVIILVSIGDDLDA